MDDQVNLLRQQADEIAAAGHAGWGNTMRDAADEIERLTKELASDLRGVHTCHDNCQRIACVQRREIERLRARVDALMLEYCPDEMTPEQVAEWGKHQRPVARPSEKEGT